MLTKLTATELADYHAAASAIGTGVGAVSIVYGFHLTRKDRPIGISLMLVGLLLIVGALP